MPYPEAYLWGRKAGIWKEPKYCEIEALKVKANGSWKACKGGFYNKQGEWFEFGMCAPSGGYSISNSLNFDGSNDWARFANSSATEPLSKIFENPGGTIAMWIKITGTTNYSNQYFFQNGWGGGWNVLYWIYPFSGSNYNIRIRQHRTSGNYGGWSCRTGGNDYNFAIGTWYFVSVSYDNQGSQNTPIFRYAPETASSLTDITSPYTEKAAQGSPRMMTAHYAAIGAGKGGDTPRPLKAHLSLFGMWDTILTEAECDTLFNSGAPSNFGDVQANKLLFFHDMNTISGSTISPVTGSSIYNITTNNGAALTADVPS